MAEESDLERTEPPSSRRLEKAREDGQVPQSRELMAFLIMAAAVGGFWSLGGWLTHQAGGILRRGLSFGRDAAFSSTALTDSFGALTWDGLLLGSPVFLLTMVAAVATPFVLHGGLFSFKALTPRFERLDPLKGMKRMFSLNSISELVKAILKTVLIGGVIYWVVTRQQGQLFALIVQPIDTALPAFGQMLIHASLALVAIYPFAKRFTWCDRGRRCPIPVVALLPGLAHDQGGGQAGKQGNGRRSPTEGAYPQSTARGGAPPDDGAGAQGRRGGHQPDALRRCPEIRSGQDERTASDGQGDEPGGRQDRTDAHPGISTPNERGGG